MKITLLRHGRPEFSSSSVGPEFPPSTALQAYAVSVVTESPPEHLHGLTVTTPICVSSQLQRAIDSARLLGFEKPVTTALLNESELPHPDQLWVNIPWSIFLVVYRVLWFTGYCRNCPGRTEDRNRATLAADYLHEQATRHVSVLAVGHGIMNRLICTELGKSGWSVTGSSGTSYWSEITLHHKEKPGST